MKINVLLLILLSILLTSFGQLSLKTGMSSSVALDDAEENITVNRICRIIFNPFVIGGLILYVVSTLVWLYVLAHVDLSIAYPFVGLGFIITMILSYFFFQEPLTIYKIAGTLTIVIGVFILTRG